MMVIILVIMELVHKFPEKKEERIREINQLIFLFFIQLPQLVISHDYSVARSGDL